MSPSPPKPPLKIAAPVASLAIRLAAAPAGHKVRADIFFGVGEGVNSDRQDEPTYYLAFAIDYAELSLDLSGMMLASNSIAWRLDVAANFRAALDVDRSHFETTKLHGIAGLKAKGESMTASANLSAEGGATRESNMRRREHTAVEDEIPLIKFVGTPEQPKWQFFSAKISVDPRSNLGPYLSASIANENLGLLRESQKGAKVCGRVSTYKSNLVLVSCKLPALARINPMKEKILKNMIAESMKRHHTRLILGEVSCEV